MSTPTNPTGKDELKALLALLTESVETVLNSDQDVPSINAPHPVPLSPTPAWGTALAASAQITAMLEGPTAAGRLGLSFHVSACLRAAIEAHAAETIRENGDATKGLHVDEIAKASNINPAKLARVLRFLAAHHIFRETSEDTFANNRLSVALDTFKPLSSLVGHKSFHTGTMGLQALVCHATDEVMKASSYLSEYLHDPETANSDEPTSTALNLAFDMKLNTFDWYNEKGNEWRLERFGMAMKGVQVVMPSAAFDPYLGFDFAKLAEKAKVVDVGGGVGTVSLALTSAFPHLVVINQDQAPVIEGEAAVLWAKEDPDAISSGRVILQSHDFFAAQPVTDASVFLLRHVIHDWADRQSIDILRNLRGSAGKDTKLILVEQLVRPLCAVDQIAEIDVPGASLEGVAVAPWPILPNGGSPMTYIADLQMMTVVNAQERTLSAYKRLGEQSGWKLERVYRPAGGVGFNQIVFGAA